MHLSNTTTHLPATVTKAGTAWENFLKRLGAFMVGGAAALIVEVVIYPVKARDRLVESLSSCILQMTHMQAAVAAGIDDPVRIDLAGAAGAATTRRFHRARDKAQAALVAAETFLPFCLSEPRLKGSFRALDPVYREIIYVLHQVIDRMDNIVQLRCAYGNSVLEDLNPRVYAHRRNVAASVTLTLFAVNEALTTRLPLPQFLPSCRLAQLRLVHRVREVLDSGESTPPACDVISVGDDKREPGPNSDTTGRRKDGGGGVEPGSFSREATGTRNGGVDETTIRSLTQQRFLSWNATAAGQMEIIEYLEELVDLAKLLVGVNAFRSGMLERPSYRQYVRRINLRKDESSADGRQGAHRQYQQQQAMKSGGDAAAGGAHEAHLEPVSARGSRTDEGYLLRRRPTTATSRSAASGADSAATGGQGSSEDQRHLPPSLQRVGDRMRHGRSLMGRMTMEDAEGED